MTKKLLAMSLCVLSLLLASCSGDSDVKALLGQIPANSDVVAAGGIKAALESAGGSIDEGKIVLPKFLTDELPAGAESQVDDINEKIAEYGLKPNAVAMFVNFDAPQPTIFFAISDSKKFAEAIEDQGFDSEDKDEELGLEVFVKGDEYYQECFGVHGDYAIYYGGSTSGSDDFSAKRYLKRIVKKADENDFGSTAAGKYIAEGNVGGVAVKIPKAVKGFVGQELPEAFASLYGSTVCLRGEVTDDDVTVVAKVFDADGKPLGGEMFKDYYDINATVSADALAYLHGDESLVYACAMNNVNWDKYFGEMFANVSRDEAAQLSVIKGYVKRIDGTVAVGVGPTAGLESWYAADCEDFSKFSLTVVAEVKDGKNKELLTELTKLCQQSQVPYKSTDSSLTIEQGEAKLYVKTDGRFVVLSNKAITKSGGNAAASAVPFTDHIGAAALVLKKDSKLMKDLGIDNDVTISVVSDAKDMEATLKFTVTGAGPDGVLAKVVKIGVDMVGNIEKIEKDHEAYYKQHHPEYTDYYDPSLDEGMAYEPDYVGYDSVAAEY